MRCINNWIPVFTGMTKTIMKKINKKDFILGEDPVSLTPGEMLATLRNLQGLTQSKLAKLSAFKPT